MNKKLLTTTLAGAIFVSVLGTLSHFIYEWSGGFPVAGLVTPVSESTWEHMKLLFFPMLLYFAFIPETLKAEYPCIPSALFSGILIGFLLIPTLFYTYTGILGRHISFIDIAIFYICVLVSFLIFYRLSLSCKAKKLTVPLTLLMAVITLLFFIFTFRPPHIGLFQSP